MCDQELDIIQWRQQQLYNQTLEMTSKPNCQLTCGSVWFQLVSVVPNNGNHPEPDGTAGQPAVGFSSCPLFTLGQVCIYNNSTKNSCLHCCEVSRVTVKVRVLGLVCIDNMQTNNNNILINIIIY